MTEKPNTAALERLHAETLHWRNENRRLYDAGTVAARIACDSYGGLRDKLAVECLDALPALLALARAAKAVADDFDGGFMPASFSSVDIALAALDFEDAGGAS